MAKKIKYALFCLFLIFVSGCAALRTGYETPMVSITSFKPVPTQGIIPQFQIGLHIVNPNRSSLHLKGVSYTIFLEGNKIISGVSNQLPQIEAYGEGDVLLNASVDLLSSIHFFTDLIRTGKKDQIAYHLEAKLDAGNLHPFIQVSQKGNLSLTQTNP